MKPDRSNYEVWFIDWLDGKLNENQAEELKIFLGENPDLAEELEMFPSLQLKPEASGYLNKSRLIRTPEGLTESQFEHLCIACLENDLTPDQSAELMELIGRDPERKRVFDLIQRLKLSPENVRFPAKSHVKRLTIPQRVLRISLVGLSAAASVALLVIAYLFLKPKPQIINDLAILNPVRDTLLVMNPPVFRPAQLIPPARIKTKHNNPGIKASEKEIPGVTEPVQLTPSLTGTETDSKREKLAIGRIEVVSSRDVKLGTWTSSNAMAGFNPGIMPPTFDPYGRRSNVDRFMARFFHERLMKDKSAGDRPVGSYELAEAGIKGLNKLLGREISSQSR